MTEPRFDATTEDQFLGGQLVIRQPSQGYRAGTDAVLLAAATPALPHQSVLEVGLGVGTASLCLAHRIPNLSVTGLEIQPDYAALARINAQANGLGERLRVIEGDAARPFHEFDLEPNSFHQVLTNPPYHEACNSRPSPIEGKAVAHMESTLPLSEWIRICVKAVRPKGILTIIHRADRLDEILRAFDDKVGGIKILPIWSAPNKPAKRIIIQAQKQSKTPLSLLPGLHLREADGSHPPGVRAILAEGAALEL